MRFPHQERLLRVRVLSLLPSRLQLIDISWSVPCIKSTITFATNRPARLAISPTDDFTGDAIRGAGFPAPLLEVEDADVFGGVICDFHGAVVVDGGRAGDDADDGGGDLLPGVEFFGAAVGGTETKEPGSEGVDVEGLAVEFGTDC